LLQCTSFVTGLYIFQILRDSQNIPDVFPSSARFPRSSLQVQVKLLMFEGRAGYALFPFSTPFSCRIWRSSPLQSRNTGNMRKC